MLAEPQAGPPMANPSTWDGRRAQGTQRQIKVQCCKFPFRKQKRRNGSRKMFIVFSSSFFFFFLALSQAYLAKERGNVPSTRRNFEWIQAVSKETCSIIVWNYKLNHLWFGERNQWYIVSWTQLWCLLPIRKLERNQFQELSTKIHLNSGLTEQFCSSSLKQQCAPARNSQYYCRDKPFTAETDWCTTLQAWQSTWHQSWECTKDCPPFRGGLPKLVGLSGRQIQSRIHQLWWITPHFEMDCWSRTAPTGPCNDSSKLIWLIT